MANDFKSFSRTNKHKVSDSDMRKIKQNFSDREIRDAQDFAKQYEGMDENQLFSEITRMAAQGKRDGSVSNTEIENFARSVAPMLDDAQKKKLMQVLSAIRK